MAAAKGSKQEKVNKSSPALYKAKLGDVVAELVAQVNALTVSQVALAAKLNADAGVTDTNYASAPNVTVKDLESR